MPASPEEIAALGISWPHDRQPDAADSFFDSAPQEPTDAERILQEDMPEPRHIPAWAWQEGRGAKRSFDWVTHDLAAQDSENKRRTRLPAQVLPIPAKAKADDPMTIPEESQLMFMWMMVCLCFRMCTSALAKVQDASAQRDSGREQSGNLALTAEPNPRVTPTSCVEMPRASFNMSPDVPVPPTGNGNGEDVSFRRRLKPMSNGQLPKVQQVLALATQHGLYKDTSQFKWLDVSSRTFQLRTPCQRACINFYTDTGSAYISGLEKFAGLKYVQGWTDADWKQPRKKKSKAANSSGQALAPLTPEQARALLEL